MRIMPAWSHPIGRVVVGVVIRDGAYPRSVRGVQSLMEEIPQAQ
jgi:hypothetical protein